MRTRAAAPLALAVAFLVGQDAVAQTANGEWRGISADAASTRSTPLDQIKPANFDQLEVAWEWTPGDADVLPPVNARGCPIYFDGMLINTAGDQRTIVSMNPATGETLWTWREPLTPRADYSMRSNHGKGVTYTEINGKPAILMISPGFFLHALDPKTGKPLENWGAPVGIEGWHESGTVDLIKDLISDWPRWTERDEEYNPEIGIPLELGYITSSSPAVVVNGVIVVNNSAEQGYNQSRIENVPGDILGYDLQTGKFLWKFHVLPRPGEFGHDTWENDAWSWTGDISSWAPMSYDEELGLVYIPTNGATMDFYGGFRPGNNLFSTSLIALDVKTGKRAWHYQLVHHDIWNYDTPVAPVLLDVTMNGETVPIVVQATKQGWAYTFNRKTGEPIWPIEEKPVKQSKVPGEHMAPTQPFPSKPASYTQQGLEEDDLIDFTPELRAAAIEHLKAFDIGPIFNPPLHSGNEEGFEAAVWIPGDVGGVNITGPAVADPATGILYITSLKGGSARILEPGTVKDERTRNPTGSTIVDFAPVGSGRWRTLPGNGLSVFKPPYSSITAIDMNTGDHIWQIPIGETPSRIKNNPALAGIDIGNTGTGSHAAMLVTPSMLVYTGNAPDPDAAAQEASARGRGGAARGGRGGGRGGRGGGRRGGFGGDPAWLFAVDKATGETLGKVRTPSRGSYGLMSYMHDGQQYMVLQVSGRLIAMSLPESARQDEEAPAAGGAAAAADLILINNPLCPLMEEPVVEGYSVVYKNAQILMCCDDCIVEWNRYPEKDKDNVLKRLLK